MTPAEIDQLEQKWKASTQGEWFLGGPYPSVSVLVCVDPGCGWPEPEPPYCEPVCMVHQCADDGYGSDAPAQSVEDANFIAAAHNAMPQLINAAREAGRLRHELAARDALLNALHGRAYMRGQYDECTEIERLIGLPSVVEHELEDLR